jgi:G3E family GTPase
MTTGVAAPCPVVAAFKLNSAIAAAMAMMI